MKPALLRLLALCLVAVALGIFLSAVRADSAVTILRLPTGAIQPQLVERDSTVYLLYYTGDPAHGNIFYTRFAADAASIPLGIRVNSLENSAMALGTIRGAQIAVGRNGRVYAAWNGVYPGAKPAAGQPMVFARLNGAGDAFEPQRILSTWATGLDGGGSIAADNAGNVYAVWHVTPQHNGEANGGVFLARSTDDGATFAREAQISPPDGGQCGCCSMKAFAASDGKVYVLYRGAAQSIHRDTISLVSSDHGATFQAADLDAWNLSACPMTTFAFTESPDGVVGAWETQGQVKFALVSAARPRPTAAPGAGARKYPTLARDASGQTLFAWVDGAGWARGGSLCWQIYDAAGNPTADSGQRPGVPAWSMVAAYAKPGGGFVVVY